MLVYYLGRALTPNEAEELRKLLNQTGCSDGVTLDVLTDILQQVKDASGNGSKNASAAPSRASSRPSSKRSSASNKPAGRVHVHPVAIFSSVLSARNGSAAAPVAPVAKAVPSATPPLHSSPAVSASSPFRLHSRGSGSSFRLEAAPHSGDEDGNIDDAAHSGGAIAAGLPPGLAL